MTRAVTERQVGGRAMPLIEPTTYSYNRAADYSGDEHTIITKTRFGFIGCRNKTLGSFLIVPG